jgi:hypothetical protein
VRCHTSDWVAEPASQKLMNNQLESSRLWNSEEMTGCVARTSDPSTLDVKTPVVIVTEIHELLVFHSVIAVVDFH